MDSLVQTAVNNQSENYEVQKPRIKLRIIQPEDVIDNNWKVIDIVRKHPPVGWKDVFNKSDDELKDISDILENDKKVNGRFYPDNNYLFRAFDLTPLQRVKVVIVGQDPYHGVNPDGTPQAQGMCFSVKRGSKIPPSLINIYKELKNTVPGFITPHHGDLTRWARQGVLLMNACLTVRPHNPGCHKELWLGFVKKVINAILEVNPNAIFVVWGKKAQKIKKMLGERATILEAAHPSGYSAYRGFFGCDHFNQINNILRDSGQTPINWKLCD